MDEVIIREESSGLIGWTRMNMKNMHDFPIKPIIEIVSEKTLANVFKSLLIVRKCFNPQSKQCVTIVISPASPYLSDVPHTLELIYQVPPRPTSKYTFLHSIQLIF